MIYEIEQKKIMAEAEQQKKSTVVDGQKTGTEGN